MAGTSGTWSLAPASTRAAHQGDFFIGGSRRQPDPTHEPHWMLTHTPMQFMARPFSASSKRCTWSAVQ